MKKCIRNGQYEFPKEEWSRVSQDGKGVSVGEIPCVVQMLFNGLFVQSIYHYHLGVDDFHSQRSYLWGVEQFISDMEFVGYVRSGYFASIQFYNNLNKT